ncbi:MAG: IMP cyclohydrolase [Halobacteriales archaeon]|nr:IMP cyclohydrolase [Halobacteriales archaeon]
MYVGRFVIVGPGIGAYRVSSRSFPHRQVTALDARTLVVEPTPDAAPTANPYVSYHCARAVTDRVVLGNGSHVDPIAEKLERGYPARDALVEALLALDYEKDDYDTPRLAGIVAPDAAHVGIVRKDALVVEAVDEPTLVATYERDAPETYPLDAGTAEAAARAAYEEGFEHPVCAAGATVAPGQVELASYNGPDG